MIDIYVMIKIINLKTILRPSIERKSSIRKTTPVRMDSKLKALDLSHPLQVESVYLLYGTVLGRVITF